MGFSFSDHYLNELRASILTMLGNNTNIPLAYAITDSKGVGEVDFYLQHEGVQFLNFNPIGDDYSEFDTILQSLHLHTYPKLRFFQLLQNKRILWIDDGYCTDNFHGASVRSQIDGKYIGTSIVTYGLSQSHLTCCSILEAARLIEGTNILQGHDLIITSYGVHALHIIKEIRNYQIENIHLDNNDSDDIHLDKCPIVLIHDANYIEIASEIIKGRSLRLGACDYTTDNKSLVMAIVRICNVLIHGNLRDGFRVPGFESCKASPVFQWGVGNIR